MVAIIALTGIREAECSRRSQVLSVEWSCGVEGVFDYGAFKI